MKTWRVRFVEGKTAWPYARQTPGGHGRIGQSVFLFGHGQEPADWLVVLDQLAEPIMFPAKRSIFLAGEPVAVKRYHPSFLAQFGTVVTTDVSTPHPNRVISNPGLPWHVGVKFRQPECYDAAMTYGQLLKAPEKTKLCSCICSDKSFTPSHRRRLAFVDRLRQEFGGQIEFFGWGFRDIADKSEALDAFRYHIVLENSVAPHYWTEKLADAYLRNCMPIYAGAPNVADYFGEQALVSIDMADAKGSMRVIRRILASDADRRAAAAIEAAKQLVLTRYNVLAIADRLIADRYPSATDSAPEKTILPESHFLPNPERPGALRRAAGRVRQTVGALKRRLLT